MRVALNLLANRPKTACSLGFETVKQMRDVVEGRLDSGAVRFMTYDLNESTRTFCGGS